MNQKFPYILRISEKAKRVRFQVSVDFRSARLHPLVLGDVVHNRDDVHGKLGAVFAAPISRGEDQAQPCRAQGALHQGLL